MNALSRLFFILMLGGILLAPAARARANDEWKQADSENFHIVSNAAPENTAKIAGKLEDFRKSFFDLFQQTEVKSPIPTRILIFNSGSAEILKNSNESPKNLFQEGQDANYIIVSLNGAETDLRPIYHRYFHYLLSNHVGKSKIPAWLNEGLAEIYENFQRDEDLKTFLRDSEQTKNELLRRSKFLPAEIFFSTDYYSLNQQQNHGSGVFSAQAAALVDYLSWQSKDDEFKRFVNFVSTGISVNEALIKAFKLDLATVERNLKIFIDAKSNEKTPPAVNQSSKTSALNFSPVSEAETESYLGDYLYQSERFDEAPLHLLKSLALDPSASFPRSTLGLVKLRQYKRDEAFEHLEKALESKDASFLTYYRYAYALSREGMTEYGFVSNYDAETAQKIREYLDRAIELNPDFAEPYNIYALVGFVRNEELDKSLSFITKALKSAPENDWYLLRKAELEMRKENFTQARKSAIEIYRNAAGPGLRLYAQNTIQRIDSTEYQLLLSRRYEKLPYSDAISDKPFSDEEIACLRARAMRESLAAALRQPAPDEKRILGNILGIDCKQNQVDFTVKTDDQIIKLYAESFEMLKLMTFNPALSKSQIGCGASNVENAVIIYKNPQISKPDISGEIVSVEFVPKEFTLSVKK